nr:SRPBCC domain-containing protein [Cohnella sp. CFH 77786]
MSANAVTTSVKDRELTVTREFRAPRRLVFETWSDPEHLKRWWGPKGFTITVSEFDFRPGGVWLYVMHGPGGVDYDNKITYREISNPERLFTPTGISKRMNGSMSQQPSRNRATSRS